MSRFTETLPSLPPNDNQVFIWLGTMSMAALVNLALLLGGGDLLPMIWTERDLPDGYEIQRGDLGFSRDQIVAFLYLKWRLRPDKRYYLTDEGLRWLKNHALPLPTDLNIADPSGWVNYAADHRQRNWTLMPFQDLGEDVPNDGIIVAPVMR